MKYLFPHIAHIDDMRFHVDDALECFRIVDKDTGHTFINYKNMSPDTFPALVVPASDDPFDIARARAHNHRAAIRREGRGIAFDTETGDIVSRPFHKFFNVGEREEMDVSNLDFDQEHWVCDKVDGSMLRPLPTAAGVRWGTKMGVTDVALDAEAFVQSSERDYDGFAQWCFSKGITPLFEYVGPHNRVVVEYKEDMILLALRRTVSGEYYGLGEVETIAAGWNIPTPAVYNSVVGDASVFVEGVKTRREHLDEGVIIQWYDGHRAKIKTEMYSILHRIKESSRTERTLVTAIRAGDVDDLLPLVSVADRAEIEAYIKRYYFCVNRLAEDIRIMYEEAREDFAEKKDFAISDQGARGMTRMEASVVFSMWDGKTASAADAAERIIEHGLVSETKWAEMKENLRMATKFNDFETVWHEKGDFE